jgi:hypothetical protein
MTTLTNNIHHERFHDDSSTLERIRKELREKNELRKNLIVYEARDNTRISEEEAKKLEDMLKRYCGFCAEFRRIGVGGGDVKTIDMVRVADSLRKTGADIYEKVFGIHAHDVTRVNGGYKA